MVRRRRHNERHMIGQVGWLRAAVLGANDGIISTAILIVGVAAAAADKAPIMAAGVAGLVAGAMSMATGEYVSVRSQADTQAADLAREAHELDTNAEFERRELAGIYEERGLTPDLAGQVAEQLMRADALGAHARDELGISHATIARPIEAAWTSAAAFAAGAALPLAAALIAPLAAIGAAVALGSLAFLAALGAVGARAGGAPVGKAIARVTLLGALAMGVTAAIGRLFGTLA